MSGSPTIRQLMRENRELFKEREEVKAQIDVLRDDIRLYEQLISRERAPPVSEEPPAKRARYGDR